MLEAIVTRILAPKGDENAPVAGAHLRLPVFNPFRGIIIACYRVFNGTPGKGDHVKFFNTGSE